MAEAISDILQERIDLINSIENEINILEKKLASFKYEMIHYDYPSFPKKWLTQATQDNILLLVTNDMELTIENLKQQLIDLTKDEVILSDLIMLYEDSILANNVYTFSCYVDDELTKVFRLKNVGKEEILFTGVPYKVIESGDVDDEISLVTPFGISKLLVDDYIDLTVNFTPQYKGLKFIEYLIPTDSYKEKDYKFQIAMNVQGIAKILVEDNSQIEINNGDTIDFGSVAESGGTSDVILKIKNTGEEYLLIDSITSDNTDFTYVFTSTLRVEPGGEETLTLTFDPSALNTITGTLTIQSNARNIQTFTLNLTGIGT